MTTKEYLKQYYQNNKEKALAYAKNKRDTKRIAIDNDTYVIPEMKEKKCNCCKEVQPVSMFSFHKSSGTYQNECNPCRKNKAKQYRDNNKEIVRETERLRNIKRRENHHYRMSVSMRSRMHHCYVRKTMHSNEYLSIDNNTFDKWIQLAIDTEDYNNGLTLENYGQEWDLDHIVPCDIFDLTDNEEVKLCFHWTNIQPLKSSYNSTKCNKIIPFMIFSRDYRLYLFAMNNKIDIDEIALVTASTMKIVESRRGNYLRKVKKLKIGQSAATPLKALLLAQEEGSETKEVSAEEDQQSSMNA